MKRVVTAAQMRTLDAVSEQLGVSVTQLMQRAGAALAEGAIAEASCEGRFVVFCGGGNNGGDGLVAATELRKAGRRVSVQLWVPREKLHGAAAEALAAFDQAGGTLRELDAMPEAVMPGDVIVDALLGTGLSRPIDPPFDEAIEQLARLRASGARTVSADIPSGLKSDVAQEPERAVWADRTVSFGLPKISQVLEPGASRCGRLEIVDVGWPSQVVETLTGSPLWLLEEGDAVDRLPVRKADTHKGTYGHLLLVAGSEGRSGAAALAAKAALRSGVGKVTVATRIDALDAVLSHCPEAMGVALPGEGALTLKDQPAILETLNGIDAVAIGPGIPRGPETGALIVSVLDAMDRLGGQRPCVLDADALNAVAELRGGAQVLARIRTPLILTPHPGEMARLCGLRGAQIQADRLSAARGFATENRVTLILKGARTLIAEPDGAVFVNPTGNPGMATAGSGDVLSGTLGALLCQGLGPRAAAIVGVYAHGLAGDLAVRHCGQLGLTASDLVEALKEVWVRWKR